MADTIENMPIPISFPSSQKIVDISCGYDHTLALSESGKLYAWGYNNYGQLGLGDVIDIFEPMTIEMPGNIFIKQISCGRAHSLLLSTDGHIYSFGLNSHGQLGDGSTSKKMSPILIESDIKFTEIFAFEDISMALSEDNKVYVCGRLRDETQLTLMDTNLDSFQEAINTFSRKVFTYKPLSIKDVFHKKLINNRRLKTMIKVFNEEKYCDLKFKLKLKGSEDKYDYIYVNKWFIANTSEYFERMFANNWSQNNEITINSYSYEAYYHFLRCLYTDSIETEDTDILLEMLSISEDHLDEEFKRKCVQKIKPQMNVQNVCSIYSSSLTNRSKDLEEFCIKFMSKHMSYITETEDYKQMSDSSAKHFLTNFSKLQSNQ